MTAKTRNTMMNMDAVMGRWIPKPCSTRSTGITQNNQTNRDETSTAAICPPLEDILIPPINEPSNGITRSVNRCGKGFSKTLVHARVRMV